MQFTTVRRKEKDYNMYLKSEILFHSSQEHEKNISNYLENEKTVPTYFKPDKHSCSYLESQKSRSLLFGYYKMLLTTVRSKEKDYDIYLKSEKLVHSNQEHGKSVSLKFGTGKNWYLAISSLKNTVSAITREKKVDPCYLETKNSSSHMLREWKKIMTCI